MVVLKPAFFHCRSGAELAEACHKTVGAASPGRNSSIIASLY
jgi:hypothetical protein